MKSETMKLLQKISRQLKKEYKAKKVILFGSYTKGEQSEDSDVDLLIIADVNEGFYKRMATVRAIVRDLRNRLPLAPIVLTPEEIEKRLQMGDQFIKEIIEEGESL